MTQSSESVTRCSLSCAASAVAKSDIFSQSICSIVPRGEIGFDGSTRAAFKAEIQPQPLRLLSPQPRRSAANHVTVNTQITSRSKTVDLKQSGVYYHVVWLQGIVSPVVY